MGLAFCPREKYSNYIILTSTHSLTMVKSCFFEQEAITHKNNVLSNRIKVLNF